jgi:ribosome-associated translation inhibitor RaiA
MKLTVQHFDIRSTNDVDTLIEERILALPPRFKIDEANVRLEHRLDLSPAFRVHVHLVTPGPDVLAEGRDHTIRAAIDKVMAQLEHKINLRRRKRTRRFNSNLQSPYGPRATQALSSP